MTDQKFRQLVNLHLDQSITPAQQKALEEELTRNPTRQQEFESYRRVDIACKQAFQGLASIADEPSVPRGSLIPWSVYAAAACAMLVAGITFWRALPTENIPSLAPTTSLATAPRLTHAPNEVTWVNHSPIKVNTSVTQPELANSWDEALAQLNAEESILDQVDLVLWTDPQGRELVMPVSYFEMLPEDSHRVRRLHSNHPFARSIVDSLQSQQDFSQKQVTLRFGD